MIRTLPPFGSKAVRFIVRVFDAYACRDEDMKVIRDAGMAEVREVIGTGWLA